MGGRRVRGVRAGLVAGCLVLLPGVVWGQGPTEAVIPPPSTVIPPPSGGVVVPEEVGPPIEAEPPGPVRGLVQHLWGYVDPDNAEIISVHQLACLIDCLDKALFCKGQVVVKAPDVWGQNRLTQYRAEYEDQMRNQLNSFEVILNGYQRRADLAALTSATAIGAAASAPQISNSRRVTTTTNNNPPAIPSAAGLVGPTGLVANANSLIGTMTPVLMPSNLTALALGNKGASQGLGLEPNVLLDERSNFLTYLHQLRRNNVGDDKTDMPGYSLYLVRTPVSVLPGDESIKGKGAMVTIQARHHLTPDLLANTFRNVVILDTAYQLMDAVIAGQLMRLEDLNYDCAECQLSNQVNRCDKCQGSAPCPACGSSGAHQPPSAPRHTFTIQGMDLLAASGSHSGSQSQGKGVGSEVVAIYGANNLRRLVAAVQGDQLTWYRHDPSVVSWLLSELSGAYAFVREQARRGNPAFQPAVFENIGHHVLARNYKALWIHRENWLRASAQARSDQVRPIDVLAFALMVQSIYVDRQLKYDMQVLAQRKGCACGDPDQYCFYDPWPDESSKRAFNAYVECKWPIHVFSLDPIIDQQNQLDLFSQRTELQLALATAVATGQASFENATTYARRLEQDLATINLNRTAVGFGAGETTFGWRFYPRLQTPPTPSNPRRILGIFANNGPGPDYALNNARIEPGQRECYALVVIPNFVPLMKMTTATNWFDLKTCHPQQQIDTTEMVDLGRKLQTARLAMTRLCDSGRYRPTDLESLQGRLDQLEAMLPLQSYLVELPFEGDLTGSEMFSSYNAGLGPRLLTWYGEPGQPDGSIFILGSGFTVHEMKVIVGGVALDDPTTIPSPPDPGATPPPSYNILSRNVLRVSIPPNARVITTNILVEHPGSDAKPSDPGTHTVETTTTTVEASRSAGQDRSSATDVSRKTVDTAKKTEPLPDPKKPPANPPNPCDPQAPNCAHRKLIDIHVATSNGVSNHLFVEVPADYTANPAAKTITTSVTTTTKVDATTGTTTARTDYQTTPPGIVLPPGTILPMGSGLPAGGTFVAPGAGTFNGTPSGYQPGTVPSQFYQPMPSNPAPTGGTSMKTEPPGDGDALADQAPPTELAPVPVGSPPPPGVAGAPSERATVSASPIPPPGSPPDGRPWAGVPDRSAGRAEVRRRPGAADPDVRRASAYPASGARSRGPAIGTGRRTPATATPPRAAPSPPPAAPAPRKSVISRLFRLGE